MDFATNTPGFIEEIIRHNLKWGEVISADFSGSDHKDNAVFIDRGDNTTALLIFTPSQRVQAWVSNPGAWQPTQMSKVVAGDFSGTGKTEIAVFYNYGNGQTKLWLFSAAGDFFQPRQVWDSGLDSLGVTGISEIAPGDFSRSGKTEIATFYDYDPSSTGVWVFSDTGNNSFQRQLVWEGKLF